MKPILGVIAFCLGILFVACSDKEEAKSSPIEGTWVFTNQGSATYPYPSVYLLNAPGNHSGWLISSDSIRVTFDNQGKFQFVNFKLPVSNGNYSIVQDSFLVIHPDTTGFLKFNYSYSTIFATTSPVFIPPQPYGNFVFTSDTIWFKKTTNDQLVFGTTWLTKANAPIPPSQDTLLLNIVMSYFKKK